MSATPRRAAALLLSIAALVAAGYLAPGWPTWLSPLAATLSAALTAAVGLTAVATWRGSPHGRTIGAVLLLVGAALLLFQAAGVAVTAVSPGPVPYLMGLSAATAAAGCGVLLRRRGARWLAMGVAAAGAASSGLNLSRWMLAGVVDATGWTMAIWTIGSLTVLVALFGRAAAAGDRLASHEQVWTRRDPLVRWMRGATISAIIAIPMLVVYAVGQPGALPGVAAAAAALAVLLAIAAFLAARGQLVGGALLALASFGLAALSIIPLVVSPAGPAMQIATYYAVFWLPPAACGLGCGVALLCSARRLPR